MVLGLYPRAVSQTDILTRHTRKDSEVGVGQWWSLHWRPRLLERSVQRSTTTSSPRSRNAAATTGVTDVLTKEFPQTLAEVHVEDVVENEIAREVDSLQHIGHFHGHNEGGVLVLAVRAHAVLYEA